MSVSIAIVTPWYNHRELCHDYLEAVLPELRDDDELLIVDNASDPPIEFAALRSDKNLGFVGGSNFGLTEATTDAVLFLNNDIALGTPGWLRSIRRAVAEGVLCGPLKYAMHGDVAGIKFPYIDGWCLAGMRSDLLELDGFCTDLAEPAYYSDNILSLDARLAGMHLRDVRVALRHKQSQTAQPRTNPQVQQAAATNRALYLERVQQVLVHMQATT